MLILKIDMFEISVTIDDEYVFKKQNFFKYNDNDNGNENNFIAM